MKAKGSGEVGQREKRRSECYRGEGGAEKGRCYNVKVFWVMYPRMIVSLLSARIESRSRHPPPISSFLPCG